MDWKNIPDYEGIYEVSSCGVVRTVKTGRIRKTNTQARGYLQVVLSKKGKTKTFSVHRLVLMAFLPITNHEAYQVNHKNGKKDDNRLENLEWCSCRENMLHRVHVLGIPVVHRVPEAKPVVGLHVKTKQIIKLPSAQEGKNFGFSPEMIRTCCNRKVKKHQGYVWRYLSECPRLAS